MLRRSVSLYYDYFTKLLPEHCTENAMSCEACVWNLLVPNYICKSISEPGV